MHSLATRVMTLISDSDALIQPNPVWAAWVLNLLLDYSSGTVASSSSGTGSGLAFGVVAQTIQVSAATAPPTVTPTGAPTVAPTSLVSAGGPAG